MGPDILGSQGGAGAGGEGSGSPELTPWCPCPPPPLPPGGLDVEEALPSGYPPTFIQFMHHSYAQMQRVLRRDGSRCATSPRPTASGAASTAGTCWPLSSSRGLASTSWSSWVAAIGGGGERSGLGKGTGLFGLGAHEQVLGPNQSPVFGGRGGWGFGACWGIGVLATSHQACVPTVSATLGVGKEAARRVTSRGCRRRP